MGLPRSAGFDERNRGTAVRLGYEEAAARIRRNCRSQAPKTRQLVGSDRIDLTGHHSLFTRSIRIAVTLNSGVPTTLSRFPPVTTLRNISLV